MNKVIATRPSWQEEIFYVLKAGGVRQVAYVPDAGHAHVIRRVHADPDMHPIPLTTEEDGVATVCGAWLGGAIYSQCACRNGLNPDGASYNIGFRCVRGL